MKAKRPAVDTLLAASVHDPQGFEARLNALAHRRLRLLTLVLAAVSVILLCAAAPLLGPSGVGLAPSQARVTCGILVAFAVAAGGINLLLRAVRPATGILLALDGAATGAILLMCTAIYAVDYRAGPALIPGVLGLLLMLRAVVVPSRARRTLLLSLPAAPVILAIQLFHGVMYGYGGEAVAGQLFVARVLWNQVFLLLCVALSTLTSRVTFGLRAAADRATRLGRYRLEERIGRGGMGEVYRASHVLLRRPTAVKIIRGDRLDEPSRLRFEREVRLTARLAHPNTVEIFDFGESEGGTFYYAMELLEGADLRRIVSDTGPLPPARVIHLFDQVLDALSAAHREGLVHRDIKPSNLFLCDPGPGHDFVKVMDFGLVKDLGSEDSSITGTGEVLGTPETISPEAIQGRPVGPKADLYAMGAVGCFLLTGHHAFEAATAAEFYTCHLYKDPVPPSRSHPEVPADLEGLLLRCLSKDPGDRPASAAVVRQALLACTCAKRWSAADAEQWWESYRPGDQDPDALESASTIT